MNKKNLTLALMVGTLAVTCAQHSADTSTGIRVESVGISLIQLKRSGMTAPLPCSEFYQYKIIGHYSNLALGSTPIAIVKPGETSRLPAKRQWVRLLLRSDSRTRPLDVFKSSKTENATTGHVAISCRPIELANTAKQPLLNLTGSTVNPSGEVVLCVDFIPRRPKPRGSLKLASSAIRDGQRVSVGWNRSN